MIDWELSNNKVARPPLKAQLVTSVGLRQLALTSYDKLNIISRYIKRIILITVQYDRKYKKWY